ncbi:uncharacterized protein A1O5_11300 [Cladophialophora psammophila CBS 110553]|uniref:BZIP domain-containing protein n=1 Tax=Cladophialophora psammophila CBS 110553 TaxID=1182543 RepID=W9WZ64_9EURO|nr:uncharacterized protein A1O5_11300 [Cladophialophora psammophila CBS 110553]EXJ63539.1 hypothetical protein A1O5_11300 [Cladophialophora psammophila CBS 110553]
MPVEFASDGPAEKRRRNYRRVGAQLEKKRAQDREAQRAFRNRTKELVAQQEAEIAHYRNATAHLQSQLQAAQDARRIAQEKADHLNQELERMLNTLRMLTRPYDPRPPLPRTGLELDNNLFSIPSNHLISVGHDGPIDPLANSFRLPPLTPPSISSTDQLDRPLPFPGRTVDSIQTTIESTEGLMTTPIFCESTCALDTILINFLTTQQSMSAMGLQDQAAGPPAPNLSRVLDLTSSWPTHALSRVISDILSRFDVVRELPEKTAVHWTFHNLLRVRRGKSIPPSKITFGSFPGFDRGHAN